jgi:hypothetical protein
MHLNQYVRTLKYLNGKRRLGLLFKYEVTDEHEGLVAYADADWANDRLEAVLPLAR